ncbi:MAG: LysR family transcriptional regulator [Prevotella sp.]|nr:LysR family transcriptional regulator [Prevotella sp.]
MNIQQLEYIVALDKYRHFVKAAESCNVSQPTLSSLVQKLEHELDITIFDRSTHPIRTTEIGDKIIAQARVILYNIAQLKEMTIHEKDVCMGQIRIGVIPTVAPYILPKLFKQMHSDNPQIDLKVSEMRTAVIIDMLQKAQLDMAILATPLEQDDILEIPLYYEKFLAYVSPQENLYKEEEIDAHLLPTENLWVLKEGHCMRNQVFNFCDTKPMFSSTYEAGSIDTLVKIVDENGGYTIIPELHLPLLSNEQRTNVRPLKEPVPVREISLVIRNDFVKERMLNIIVNAIKKIIPEEMIDTRLKKFAVKL